MVFFFHFLFLSICLLYTRQKAEIMRTHFIINANILRFSSRGEKMKGNKKTRVIPLLKWINSIQNYESYFLSSVWIIKGFSSLFSISAKICEPNQTQTNSKRYDWGDSLIGNVKMLILSFCGASFVSLISDNLSVISYYDELKSSRLLMRLDKFNGVEAFV